MAASSPLKRDCDAPRGSYTAALVATVIVVPIIALIVNIGLYFVRGNLVLFLVDVRDTVRNSMNIISALIVGLIGWLGFAFWYSRFTLASMANTSAFGELCQQYEALVARIPDNPPYAQASTPVGAAYRQAKTHRDEIFAELSSSEGALRWVTASGYVNVWRSVHRLQEAIIIFDMQETVIAEARQDEWRLKGSAIDDTDTIVTTLRYALTGLGVPPAAGTVSPAPPPSPPQARALLATVRYTINEFRDSRRDGLVRARNRLMTTGVVTGMMTNALLALIVLALREDTDQRKRVITAGILFFVGAIIGLFNRLYLDGKSDNAVEDFGLSTSRLIMTPLISGLAAVGGVLISVLLPSVLEGVLPVPERLPPTIATASASAAAATQRVLVTPITTATPTAAASPAAFATAGPVSTPTSNPAAVKTATLKEVFDVERYPFEIVLAAIFGLTPGLLISRLQQQTERYKADLTSTQTSEQSPRTAR